MGIPLFFRPLKEVSNLNDQTGLMMDRPKMKKEVQILVIDDGKFPFLDILKSNDYQIKHYKDVSDLQVVENFDVILCDIQGVGKKLNPTLQGAHLIIEIKKNYPFKQVIGFTANPSDPTLVQQYSHADKFLPKDANERQWIEELDECIEKARNPVKQWINIRKVLLDLKVSTKTVAHLESCYVESLLVKDKEKLLGLKSSYPKIPPEVWNILAGLMGAMLKGAITS